VTERWPLGPDNSSWLGRLSDLCVLSLSCSDEDERRPGFDNWLFGSGRPCLLLPDTSRQVFSLDSVLICWDFSQSAARAVADALPLLQKARRVQIAVFRGEKDIPLEDAGKPLAAFLLAHGISAEAEDVEIDGRKIGRAILDHAESIGANLVVLGAFGHSRLQEFLLGGATKELLDKSNIPLLMSH
jgi:nucleotide-binding universal stress UspA family protein